VVVLSLEGPVREETRELLHDIVELHVIVYLGRLRIAALQEVVKTGFN